MISQSNIPASGSSRLTRSHPGVLITALILMILLVMTLLNRMETPIPKGTDVSENQFSAGRAMNILKELLAENVPHPTGSREIHRVQDRIVKRLQELDYHVEIQESFTCGDIQSCFPVKNIMTRLNGSKKGPAVVLMAHYDSRPSSPGAADDGSGVATILEMARLLRKHPPLKNPIILLFTDAEEPGLLGAKAFVTDHPWAHQVGVVINLEARGTRGLSLLFETSENNAWLVSAYAKSVPRPFTSSLFFQIYRNMANDTDLTIFKRHKIHGLNLAFVDNSVYYHTPLDNLEHLDLGSLQHQGDTALALVQKFGGMNLKEPQEGNAVYSDILGLTVLHWPETWTIPLALLVDLLLLTVIIKLVRRGQVSIKNISWGFLSGVSSVLIPVLFGFALLWIVRTLTGAVTPWLAHPSPMRLAVWSSVLFVGVGMSMVFIKSAKFWGLGMGVWLFWALLFTLSAFMMPFLSIYFMVPLGIAAFGLALVQFTPLQQWSFAPHTALILPALMAGVFWIQLAMLLEMVLGFELAPAIILALGLVLSTLQPLFDLSKRLFRWLYFLPIASAIVMVVAIGVSANMPLQSEKRPRVVNLTHFEDRDSGKAHWVAVSFSGDYPEQLRRIGQFKDSSDGVFPWSVGPCLVATANVSGESAPILEKLSEEIRDNGRIIRVRLHSPRGGNWIALIISQDALLDAVNIEGKSVPFQPSGETYWYFGCGNPPGGGCSLELKLKSNDPIDAMVIDLSYGLPDGGEQLIKARSPMAVPGWDGDVSMIMFREKL